MPRDRLEVRFLVLTIRILREGRERERMCYGYVFYEFFTSCL
jgi:hypothetical protein